MTAGPFEATRASNRTRLTNPATAPGESRTCFHHQWLTEGAWGAGGGHAARCSRTADPVEGVAPRCCAASIGRKQREQFIEQFVWKDGNASDTAHQTPEVMAVWEPIGPVLEELTTCEVEPV
jgi:hypothetical protein